MNRQLITSTGAAVLALSVGASLWYVTATAQTPPQGQSARRGPGKGPGGKGPMQGMMPTANAGAPGAATKAAGPPPPPRVHRRGVDPFYVPWTVPPPPPYVFESILPVRVADTEIEPPPAVRITVREEPALRVSGIMTGDGVFAILEQSGGKVDIVKPGSSVDISVASGARTYRVVSIKEDTVTLESVEGLKTFQQIVPLSDAPIGTSPSSFGGGGGRPQIGAPGSFGGGVPGGKRGAPGLSPGGGPAGGIK